jgi:hypothetical protein
MVHFFECEVPVKSYFSHLLLQIVFSNKNNNIRRKMTKMTLHPQFALYQARRMAQRARGTARAGAHDAAGQDTWHGRSRGS